MGKNMKKMLRLFFLICFALTFSACVTSPLPLSMIYGNNKGTMHVFPNKIGKKVGKTCSLMVGLSYLPFFIIGDNSVKTAADNGNITQISLVDFEQENFLFSVYSKTCIIVYGD
jgi:hypothetical protein